MRSNAVRSRKDEAMIRSGRFRAPTANQPIIQVEEDTDYRILNAGEVPFTLSVTGLASTLTVSKNCAVDVKVPTGGQVTVNGAALSEIEGVFDILSDDAPGRSGRFKGAGTDSAPIAIIQGRAGTVYRIFNAGEQSFALRTASGDSAPLDRQCSRDVLVTDDTLSARRADNLLISGVFDAVGQHPSLRSGRFRVLDGVAAEHDIIDRRGGIGGRPQRYRISNAGDNPFIVRGQRGMTMTDVVTLSRDQSIDLHVRGSVNARVSVIASANNSLITGIYDYLGEA